MATLSNARSDEFGPQYDEGIRLTDEPMVHMQEPHAQDGPQGGTARGQPPSGGSTNWVIIAAVIAVVAIIVIIVVVLVSRGGGGEEAPVVPVTGHFIPILYSLNMFPQIPNGTFSGSVAITGALMNATNSIELNSVGLEIVNVTIRTNQNRSLTGINVKTNDALQVMRFDISDPHKDDGKIVELHPGNHAITIMFRGKLEDGLKGFYRSSFMQGNTTKYLATTQFEPTDARRAFPCFDDPSLKAKFSIAITVPKHAGYTVLSNGKEIGRYGRPNSTLTSVLFETTPPMSTYLVAFIVGDLVKGQAPVRPLANAATAVPINVYVTPGKQADALVANEFARAAVDYYAKLFKIPYQMSKLDLVAIPDFAAGAMENWGLITFRETDLLLTKKGSFISSTQQHQRVAKVVCHEIAHQWFGNLVTMKWWNDLWLNEGFASFLEYGCVQNIGKDIENFWGQFVHYELQRALEADSLESAHSLSQKVEKDSDIPQMFDAVTYAKGASLIRQLESFMESQKTGSFFAGLSSYLNKHKFKNAAAVDLWDALSEQLPANPEKKSTVASFMSGWVEKPGYPVITVKNETISHSVHQRRFLANREVTGDSKWTIKIRYRGDGDKVQPDDALLTDQESSQALPVPAAHPTHKWIKLNYNQTGFYRVNYPESMWSAFKHEIAWPKELGDSDLAGLMDDAFALSATGASPQLNVTVALGLVQAMSNNTEYIAWAATIKHLRRMRRMFTDTSAKSPQPIQTGGTGTQSGGSQTQLLETAQRIMTKAIPATLRAGDNLLAAAAAQGNGTNATSPSPSPSPSPAPAPNATTASPSPVVASPSPSAGRWKADNYTECEKAFKNYLTVNLHKVAKNLTYNGKFFVAAPRERPSRMLLRASILEMLGELGDTLVVAEAKQLLPQLTSATSTVSPDLRYAVATAAMANDYSNKTWVDYQQRYLKSSNPAEKAMYLDLLALTPNTELIQKTLDFALSKDVRQQDGIYLLMRVFHNRAGKATAFSYVQRHFDDIEKRYSSSSALSRLVFAIGEAFNTADEKRAYENFFETKLKDIPSAANAFERGKQAIDANSNWVDQNQDTICAWLWANMY